jgi:hypothetical protein
MSGPKRGPPAHQNKVAWVPARADKHNTLKKIMAALPNSGVCQKCHDIIEWKKQYGKYKPLKVPAKCVGCSQRTVELAYHVICQDCARSRRACAKCQEAMPAIKHTEERERLPDAAELAEMNERQRRAALRKIAKAKKAAKEARRNAEGAALDDEDEPGPEEDEEEAQEQTRPHMSAPNPPLPDVSADREPAASNASPVESKTHQGGANLATLGHVPTLVEAVDTSSDAQWSGRDQEGRSDDDASYFDDDAAAVAAVEAEAVTEDEDDDEEEGIGSDKDDTDDGDDDGDDDDDDGDDDEDDDDGVLREQIENLAHSPGAAALVLQGFEWLQPAKHLQLAEAAFDALCERVSGHSPTTADAMTDRVATVAQRVDADGSGDDATALAMLLELECFARILPASFDADCTDVEAKARALLVRGAQERSGA